MGESSGVVKVVVAVIVVAGVLAFLFMGGGGEQEGVEYWHTYGPPEIQAQQKIMEKFYKEFPGPPILPHQVPYKDKKMKFVQAVRANAQPDMSRDGMDSIPVFGEMGVLEPLPEHLKDPEYLADFAKGALECCYYKGELVALPETSFPNVYFYRKDWFAQKGLKVPATWDEFVAVAKALTEDTDGDGKIDRWGLGQTGDNCHWLTIEWLPWLWNAGGDVFGKDGKLALDSPQAVEALRFWCDLKNKHKVVPTGVMSNEMDENRELFGSGRVAMTMSGAWELTRFDKMQVKGKYGVFEYPRRRPDDPPASTFLGVGVFYVFKGSPHAKRAFEFMEYALRPENNLEWCVALRTLPVRLSNYEHPHYQDEISKVFASAQRHSRPWPQIPQWNEMMLAFQPIIQSAMLEEATPEQACMKMQREALRIMGERNAQ